MFTTTSKNPIVWYAEPEFGTVQEALITNQKGWITYQGVLWSAKTQNVTRTIAPGERVKVLGRQGNSLLVMPESEAEMYSQSQFAMRSM